MNTNEKIIRKFSSIIPLITFSANYYYSAFYFGNQYGTNNGQISYIYSLFPLSSDVHYTVVNMKYTQYILT